MKLPSWLQAELELIGRQVISGERSRGDAAGVLAEEIFERDESLAHAVAADFARKQLRRWVNTQLHGGGYPARDGGQLELFPWLPAFLETSPGRFARVDTMTGEDWDAAVKQAEVKAGNADAYAKGIRRAYDQVRPLLDGPLTTADVADQLAP